MAENLLPVTVMLDSDEIKELVILSEKEKRSKSSILRLAFSEYCEKKLEARKEYVGQ